MFGTGQTTVREIFFLGMRIFQDSYHDCFSLHIFFVLLSQYFTEEEEKSKYIIWIQRACFMLIYILPVFTAGTVPLCVTSYLVYSVGTILLSIRYGFGPCDHR